MTTMTDADILKSADALNDLMHDDANSVTESEQQTKYTFTSDNSDKGPGSLPCSLTYSLSIDEVFEKIQASPYFYERLSEGMRVVPYFDFDFGVKSLDDLKEHSKNMKTIISKSLKDVFPDGKILLAQSHGLCRKRAKKDLPLAVVEEYYKFSLHALVRGCGYVVYFQHFGKSYEDAINDSLKKHTEEMGYTEILKNIGLHSDRLVMDPTVYARTQSMRTLFSAKLNDSTPEEQNLRILQPCLKLPPSNKLLVFAKYLIANIDKEENAIILKRGPIKTVTDAENTLKKDLAVIADKAEDGKFTEVILTDLIGKLDAKKRAFDRSAWRAVGCLIKSLQKKYNLNEKICLQVYCKISRDSGYVNYKESECLAEYEKFDDSKTQTPIGEGTLWHWLEEDVKPKQYKILRAEYKKLMANEKLAQINKMNENRCEKKMTNRFDDEDDYCWDDFDAEFRNKTFITEEELIKELVPKMSRVMARITHGNGYFCKKESPNEVYLVASKYENINFAVNHLSANGGKCEVLVMNYVKRFAPSYKSITCTPRDEPNPKIFNVWCKYKAALYRKPLDASALEGRDLILNHIKKVWTSDNEEVYKYVLTWFHYLLSGKVDKVRQALVCISAENGIGKNRVTDFLSYHVFSECHVWDTSGIDSIVNKFNVQMQNKRMVVVNELCAAHNTFRSSFDKMKNLISETTICIEPKCKDAFRAPNTANFILFSNNTNAMLIDNTDRRYVFLDTNECKRGDTAYFKMIEDKCFNDACGKAFYDYIISIPESDLVNLDIIPETSMRARVLATSRPAHEQFFIDFDEALHGSVFTEDGSATVNILPAVAGIDVTRNGHIVSIPSDKFFKYYLAYFTNGNYSTKSLNIMLFKSEIEKHFKRHLINIAKKKSSGTFIEINY